jgi:serine/threonine-protein kinase mTOR
LIRVAILWHELWHEGLEEASRLYFGERNVKGMFEKLEPLHAMILKGPQTLKETSFNQAYGRDLQDAQEWCARYKVCKKNRKTVATIRTMPVFSVWLNEGYFKKFNFFF